MAEAYSLLSDPVTSRKLPVMKSAILPFLSCLRDFQWCLRPHLEPGGAVLPLLHAEGL